MTRTLLALVLAGFAAAPAFAQGDMTCADFSALDSDAQAGMVGAMAGDATGSMMSGPADDDAAGMMAAPSDDAAGAMMSGGDDAAGGMMASGGDDAAGGMMASGDDGSDNEQTAATVATLCADNPAMSLEDAMSGAMSGEAPSQ